MSSFFIFALAFIAVAVRNVMKNGGPPARGLHGQMDTRRRRSSRSAAPYRASRLPPPPSGRPSSLPPPPPAPGDQPIFRTPDPAELDEPKADIAPAEVAEPDAADESIVRTPDPDELDDPEPDPEPVEAMADRPAEEPEPEPPAEADVDPDSTPSPDASLDLVTVIRAVFGDDGSARERADRFESDYAGQRVSWTARALRSFTTRRDRIQVERVELFLGHTTDEERFSGRVMAEAFFAEGTEIERDTDITFTATLAEANVYARRMVLDGAEII